MTFYRKKPVVIEALQFTGNNFFEIAKFIGHGEEILSNLDLHDTDAPVIRTLEGSMATSIGDWVIKGVKGEFYPCKNDIFKLTYEKV